MKIIVDIIFLLYQFFQKYLSNYNAKKFRFTAMDFTLKNNYHSAYLIMPYLYAPVTRLIISSN